jgi:hypothetical protein
MKNLKIVFVFVLTFLLLIVLVACVGETLDDNKEEQLVNDLSDYELEREEVTPEPKQGEEDEEETVEVEVTLEPPEVLPADYYMEIFMPIINAFAMLEQSGYAASDFVCDSLLAIQLEWGSFTMIADSISEIQRWVIENYDNNELPMLVYALHQITPSNHRERPELFIGIKSNGQVELLAIYVIEAFNHDPAIGVERGVRVVFCEPGNDKTTVTAALAEHSVITSTRRHQDGGTIEHFRILGPGIGCGWLDEIVTFEPRQRYRICFIGPCDFCEDGYNRITEEEYLEIIYKYGTAGHNVEVEVEARYVALDWRPVEYSVNNSETQQTKPHPLARALKEYMAGNIVIHNPYILYPDLHRVSNEVRLAELVTLDDLGTMGVLLEIDDEAVSKVLLYVYNEELLYNLQGWSHHGAFGAGRYNRLMSDMHGQVRIYTLESGRVVISTSWVDASLDGGSFYFNEEQVTEDEFKTLVEHARARYGMDDSWTDRFDQADQTAQILSLTVKCIPVNIHPAVQSRHDISRNNIDNFYVFD